MLIFEYVFCQKKPREFLTGGGFQCVNVGMRECVSGFFDWDGTWWML